MNQLIEEFRTYLSFAVFMIVGLLLSVMYTFRESLAGILLSVAIIIYIKMKMYKREQNDRKNN